VSAGSPPGAGPGALRTMLEARSVAVVGASARPGSFGHRMVSEVSKSRAGLEIHLVNPRYDEVLGISCVASLADVPAPVDLVLLGVSDAGLERQLEHSAARGDAGAVIFGMVHDTDPGGGAPLRTRLTATAQAAGMSLCGGGCMGFVNLVHGLRAVGYVEPDPLPRGPVALVSHSGSAFSALLRTHRRIGFTLAVSSGQELVTSAADYLDYALDLPGTRVVALLLEALRAPDSLRAALARAAAADVPVVALTVGGSPRGRTLVRAHSGALAGEDGAWEALFDAYGVVRVSDLDEMVDTLELFTADLRAPTTSASGGIATVHDSGAERALVADVAHGLGVPFAALSESTTEGLARRLDPGLEPTNPLDLWGTGEDAEEVFAGALIALGGDADVAAVALCVDLVPEFDDDDSYVAAALGARRTVDKPLVVLSNVHNALDQNAAGFLRDAGIPVLEGTRTGLLALRHLLEYRDARNRPPLAPAVPDDERRHRWEQRLAEAPLSGPEAFALLEDYGITTTPVIGVTDREGAVAAGRRLGFPIVLKTDEPGIDHKSEVGGVVLGLGNDAAVGDAYDDLARRLGPRAVVCATVAPGVELALGVVSDPDLGPLVVVGAGGSLVEVLRDRAVALPPVDVHRARAMLDRLGVRAVLGGVRGAPACDMEAVARAVVAGSILASELGGRLDALDVNPLMCGAHGAIAVDVLVVARPA